MATLQLDFYNENSSQLNLSDWGIKDAEIIHPPLEFRNTLEQAPSRVEADISGSGDALVQPFDIRMICHIAYDFQANAETALDSLFTMFFRQPNSMAYIKATRGSRVAWRALRTERTDDNLLGRSIQKSQYPVLVGDINPTNSSYDFELRVTFLPRFPHWTATQVTNLAEFNAATKRLVI